MLDEFGGLTLAEKTRYIIHLPPHFKVSTLRVTADRILLYAHVVVFFLAGYVVLMVPMDYVQWVEVTHPDEPDVDRR